MGAIVLGWQIALQPLAERAPPALAVRLAPGSPLTLRRAAESELSANRPENAAALARDALQRAPFDVRALRVVGLTEARSQRMTQADQILTLAGNWSLRDDPSHAWLVERRLRTGDYGSAFAHADTLVRRQERHYPAVFQLFTVAALQDPDRAMPHLTRLLSARPKWRWAYFRSLDDTPEKTLVAANLAILLERGSGGLTNLEKHRLYSRLLRQRQFVALKATRDRIDPHAGLVANGDFGTGDAPLPFGWDFLPGVNLTAEVVSGEPGDAGATLWVNHDGFQAQPVARQLLLLAPGQYHLRYRARGQSDGRTDTGLTWTVTCAPSGNASATLPVGSTGPAWGSRSTDFTITADCPAQWLSLLTTGSDQTRNTNVWLDDVAVTSARLTEKRP